MKLESIGSIHRTRRIYAQLQNLALPHMEAYFMDLMIHDWRMLRTNPTTRTLFVVREYGTHAFPLYQPLSDAWPEMFTEERYLFGMADRWHMLRNMASCIISCVRNNINGAFILVKPVDELVTECSRDTAQGLALDWLETTTRTWAQQEYAAMGEVHHDR